MPAARLVRIRNIGNEPFTDKSGGATYTIPPGEEIIAEEEVASGWMGWPGLRDIPSRNIMDRTDRFKRLKLRYGWHEGTGMTEEDWDRMKPKLEVYTLDGERVYMVIDDPEGKKAQRSLEKVSPTDDVLTLQQAFERQQAELEALRRLLETKDPTHPASQGVAADVPADEPSTPPAGPDPSRTKRRTKVTVPKDGD